MVTDVAITLVLGRLMQVDDDANGEMIDENDYEIDCSIVIHLLTHPRDVDGRLSFHLSSSTS